MLLLCFGGLVGFAPAELGTERGGLDELVPPCTYHVAASPAHTRAASLRSVHDVPLPQPPPQPPPQQRSVHDVPLPQPPPQQSPTIICLSPGIHLLDGRPLSLSGATHTLWRAHTPNSPRPVISGGVQLSSWRRCDAVHCAPHMAGGAYKDVFYAPLGGLLSDSMVPPRQLWVQGARVKRRTISANELTLRATADGFSFVLSNATPSWLTPSWLPTAALNEVELRWQGSIARWIEPRCIISKVNLTNPSFSLPGECLERLRSRKQAEAERAETDRAHAAADGSKLNHRLSQRPSPQSSPMGRAYTEGVDEGYDKGAGHSLPPPTAFENVAGSLAPGEFFATRTFIFYRPPGLDGLGPSTGVRGGRPLPPPTDAWVAAQEQILVGERMRNVTFANLSFQHASWRQPNRDGGYVPVQSSVQAAPCSGGGSLTGGGASNGGGSPTGGVSPSAAVSPNPCEPPAAVQIGGSESVRFEGCEWQHVGTAYALSVGGASRRVEVTRCSFGDLSGGALKLANVDDVRALARVSSEWDEQYAVRHSQIANGSLEFRGASAIFIGYVRSLLIESNTISRVGYSGISLGWGWGRVTSFARDNRIARNLVVDAMQSLNDGGCVYTLGAQPGSSVEGNVCVRDAAPVVGCFYHDNGSRGFTTRRNVADDSRAPCIYLQGTAGGLLPAADVSVSELYCRSTAPVRDLCPANCTVGSVFTVRGEWPDAARAIIDAAGAHTASRQLGGVRDRLE